MNKNRQINKVFSVLMACKGHHDFMLTPKTVKSYGSVWPLCLKLGLAEQEPHHHYNLTQRGLFWTRLHNNAHQQWLRAYHQPYFFGIPFGHYTGKHDLNSWIDSFTSIIIGLMIIFGFHLPIKAIPLFCGVFMGAMVLFFLQMRTTFKSWHRACPKYFDACRHIRDAVNGTDKTA